MYVTSVLKLLNQENTLLGGGGGVWFSFLFVGIVLVLLLMMQNLIDGAWVFQVIQLM